MNWNEAKQHHHFHLGKVSEKRWLHLDGDLEKELVGSDGRRGYAFDDQRVVATFLGITSRTYHEKLVQQGFYKEDDDDVELVGVKPAAKPEVELIDDDEVKFVGCLKPAAKPAGEAK